MDLARIRKLIDLMKENDLTDMEIVNGDDRLVLRRGAKQSDLVPLVGTAPTPATPAPSAPAEEEHGLTPITSPLVGTFYAAASPDSAPYVKVGDRVHPDTVVCIIEAMKVMNEIKADVAGTIETISAENGKPVEFGQALFLVRPD